MAPNVGINAGNKFTGSNEDPTTTAVPLRYPILAAVIVNAKLTPAANPVTMTKPVPLIADDPALHV